METRVAVIENDMKNFSTRLQDYLDDFRSTKGTWTMVTMAIVAILFTIIGVAASMFMGINDTQTMLMKEQVEIKSNMNQIAKDLTKELKNINESLSTITNDHGALTKEHQNIKR